MEHLVSTEWLAGELGKPDLVVFDATKYLPNEQRDGRKEFAQARVPGARYFDIDEVADPDSGVASGLTSITVAPRASATSGSPAAG